jgi:hypothetical protein
MRRPVVVLGVLLAGALVLAVAVVALTRDDGHQKYLPAQFESVTNGALRKGSVSKGSVSKGSLRLRRAAAQTFDVAFKRVRCEPDGVARIRPQGTPRPISYCAYTRDQRRNGCFDARTARDVTKRVFASNPAGSRPRCAKRLEPRPKRSKSTPATTTSPSPPVASPSVPSSGSSSSHKPDNDLAIIEEGYKVDLDHPTAVRITGLLDRLERDCPSSTRLELADYTANVIQVLEQDGVNVVPTQVLEDVLQSSDLGVSDCLDIFVLLVPLYRAGAR